MNKYIIGLLLGLTAVAIGAIVFSKQSKNAFEKWQKSEYHGIIQEIKVDEENSGFPRIMINNTWLNLSLNEIKIHDYIIVGDSLSKDSNSLEIKVYRKDNNIKWIESIFRR